MCNLSDVKRDMIIGARLAGASLSRTANLGVVLSTTVSRVMTVYTNLGKVSSAKHNSGRKLKDRDRRVLKRIVAQNRKTTLPQITSEMNTHLLNSVSTKTIERELHTANIQGRVAIRENRQFRGRMLQRNCSGAETT
ncbi:transposable element Tc1 transposase [Trichonephila clavipes]|uniref:Transposable element Tc1 transposase n=1 Tax=Trichonephila clavipes TaxID=2585209 RepID=A0A8X7BGV8_TRICX|nr:transposable element Tc1 transposase [Trichonephila clavipes]